MPNWCSNVATINHGDKEKIDAIEAELKKEERDDIGVFQMLRPRPPEFDEGESWYGWNVENWGTKWEASIYDFERIDDYNIKINFDTAWSPPTALYNFLFEEGYDTTAYYDECGMAFCGKYEFGSDDFYDYSNMDSAQIQDEIPSDIDEMFSISEQMQDREAEEEFEDEVEFESQDNDDDEDVDSGPQYEMTDWFEEKDKPVREGVYEVTTKEWPYPHKQYWNGTEWRQYYGEGQDIGGDKLKINQWRGITEWQHQMIVELEKLKEEFDKLMVEETE